MSETVENPGKIAVQPSVTGGEKIWAICCYIPVFNVVTCVLTAVRMMNSKFSLFHARQGLVLFGLWFLTIVVALFSPTLSLILWIVVLVMHGYGMYIAFNMKMISMPVIGQMAAKIPEFYFYNLLTGKKVDNRAQPQNVVANTNPAVESKANESIVATPAVISAQSVPQAPAQNPPQNPGQDVPPNPQVK